jgi:hypothetical protein
VASRAPRRVASSLSIERTVGVTESTMLGEVAAWEKYRKAVRQYDAILEHAKAVSAALVGLTAQDRNVSYGEQIFVKLLGHCITLRVLAPDPDRKVQREHWDLSSMSAVARCAIEAHDAFFYVLAQEAVPAERAFRLELWSLHDKTRRLRMLEAIGSRDPKTDELRSEVATLTSAVLVSQLFARLSPSVRDKINKGDPPPYHLSQRERCASYEVNFDYYNAVTMQLSQYVHTLPFAVHQLFCFRAGNEDALRLMSLPLQYSMPFLARVTTQMRDLFPAVAPAAPSRTARAIDLWIGITHRGLK